MSQGFRVSQLQWMASVLDIVYVSEDKEKVVPLLSTIMVYVSPFLRNHSKNNVPSFRACSQLLASFSGYQYTRKAWRKDAFDLLCEPQFFQMDHTCLNHWRSIIDHLMTHDKTTYRDFMGETELLVVLNIASANSAFPETEQCGCGNGYLTNSVFQRESPQFLKQAA